VIAAVLLVCLTEEAYGAKGCVKRDWAFRKGPRG